VVVVVVGAYACAPDAVIAVVMVVMDRLEALEVVAVVSLAAAEEGGEGWRLYVWAWACGAKNEWAWLMAGFDVGDGAGDEVWRW
jgi:hypothetical protein